VTVDNEDLWVAASKDFTRKLLSDLNQARELAKTADNWANHWMDKYTDAVEIVRRQAKKLADQEDELVLLRGPK
jgi:hypothetical protein